jgi:hypothetical protein
VSISTDRHVQTLSALLRQLKDGSSNPNMCLFLGGPMAMREPLMLANIPAEVVAEDAPATVQWVKQRVSQLALAGGAVPGF